MDAKNFAKAQRAIAKIQPTLSLVMALGAVVGPRIYNMKRKRADSAKHSTQAGKGNDPSASRPVPSVAATPNDMAPQGSNGTAGGPHKGPAAFIERPIRREDWSEVLGTDDGPSV